MTVMNWMRFQSKRIKRRLNWTKPIPNRLVSPTMRLIELPQFGIFVDPQDELIGAGILLRGYYEPHLTALISRQLKRGGRFLDIGANIGYHTLTAAKKVGPKGRCLAVDLNPNNCVLLRASCEFNGFGHVEIHQKAAGAESGETTFFTPPNTGNSAIVSDRIRGLVSDDPLKAASEQRVEVIAVDDLVGDEPIDLVKIDIEGYEAKAITGMRRLLTRQKPPIVFEFFPSMLEHVGETEPFELLETLRSFGYEFREIGFLGKLSRNPLTNQEAMPRDGTMLIDLFATPR